MKHAVAACVFLALAGCASRPAPAAAAPLAEPAAARPEPPRTEPVPASRPSSADARAAAGEALDAWHAAAARADEPAYFDLFDEEGVFLGTDLTERWNKKAFRAYAHPHFEKGRAWSFRSTRRTLSLAPSGDLAWFDEDLDAPRLGAVRGSGLLVRRGGGWKVMHYVLSLTVPNDRADAVQDAVVAPAIALPDGPLADLGWLAGTWIGVRTERRAGKGSSSVVELTWTQPRGASVAGILRGPAASSIEHLLIEQRGGATRFTVERAGRVASYQRDPAKLPDSGTPAGDRVTFSTGPGESIDLLRQGTTLRMVVRRAGKEVDSATLSRAVVQVAP